ncbi:unnamed protein product [Mycena citricolor]|uniref:RING-type domain-containing protein n=1 Tax=Mycena citricolor TaxID=2018698 RepID=A0AAD2GQN3_9AGAR|nr:unnamed protein product [Mycena citricolor]
MPSQRADAATITPYLDHVVTHHGQRTLIPADNNGRRRKAKEAVSRTRSRQEPVRQESGNGGSPRRVTGRPQQVDMPLWPLRRQARQDDEIPDYPPPSFQEAMLSPTVSVCPSTITLGQYSTTTSRPSQEAGSHSQSDSESEDGSLDIVDPTDTHITAGSPSVADQSSVRSGGTEPRGRGILDSDPDDTGCSALSSLHPKAHRRHLSLSPLRTLFPARNHGQRDSASVQSIPSPYSIRNSPFSQSTVSLRNSPPPLSPSSGVFPRRFLPHKGKERARAESLDSWEIVESQLAAEDLLPPASPSGSLVDERSTMSPPSITLAPLVLRTKKAPPPPPPKKKPQLRSSPLRPGSPLDVDLDRAVRTPLPMTPVSGSPPVLSIASPLQAPASFLRSPAVADDNSQPAQEEVGMLGGSCPQAAPEIVLSIPPLSAATPVNESPPRQHHYLGRPLPRRPRRVVDSTYAPNPEVQQQQHPEPFPGGVLIDLEAELPPSPVGLGVHSNLSREPGPEPGERCPSMTSTAGQSAIVLEQHSDVQQYRTELLPGGVLIDLEAEALDSPVGGSNLSREIRSEPAAAFPVMPSTTAGQPVIHLVAPDMHRASSASSVDLTPTPTSEYLDVTDLDMLLARLEGNQHDGSDYDALWMVSEFIGPAAQPARKNTSALLHGRVEIQRRRVTKEGRVRIKPMLLGIGVDRCGICMSQFKKADEARMSEKCKHSFHARCLDRWLARSQTCPMCRVALRV